MGLHLSIRSSHLRDALVLSADRLRSQDKLCGTTCPRQDALHLITMFVITSHGSPFRDPSSPHKHPSVTYGASVMPSLNFLLTDSNLPLPNKTPTEVGVLFGDDGI